jgi:class 3 adenylate cyclase
MESRAQGQDEGPQAPAETPVPFGGTVTIFFSDIRGFTDYTEQFGDEAAYRILREHNAIVRKEIEAFGGVVVKTQGDSFMVAFKTARGAIQCAIAIQRAIAESDQHQAGPRIAIGINNTGEPIQEGGDYFGSMVNGGVHLRVGRSGRSSSRRRRGTWPAGSRWSSTTAGSTS